MSNSNPIGVFDSGVGGLSVLQQIRIKLPQENLLYVADSANAPYGNRSKMFIEERSIHLASFLVAEGAKAIVVACNTATAVAVSILRSTFPIPIIGMEPAVKPAVKTTKSGIVGILATGGTLTSSKFAMLKDQCRNGTQLISQPCPGLVEEIERGDFTGTTIRHLVRKYVSPLLDQGVDMIVLGCTHYPFISNQIRDVAGPDVMIIETSSAVAQELNRRLQVEDIMTDNDKPGLEKFWSSGEITRVERVMSHLWKKPVTLMSL